LTPASYAAVSAANIIASSVQIVMPETGTRPQTPRPQPQPRPANDNRGKDAPKPAPPPPGLGKFVDKLV